MVVIYGQLFVEAAPLLVKNETCNTYDWVSNKISFKINPSCLDSLLLSLDESYITEKDQNGKRLTFERTPMKEGELGGVLTLSNDNQQLSYLFTQSDIIGLGILLSKAKERIYGW